MMSSKAPIVLLGAECWSIWQERFSTRQGFAEIWKRSRLSQRQGFDKGWPWMRLFLKRGFAEGWLGMMLSSKWGFAEGWAGTRLSLRRGFVKGGEETRLFLRWGLVPISLLHWVHMLCHILKSNKNADKEACLLQAKIQNYKNDFWVALGLTTLWEEVSCILFSNETLNVLTCFCLSH